MKHIQNIPSYLLGAIYIFAGVMVLWLLATGKGLPAMPGLAGQFMAALAGSGYLVVIKIIELVAGVLILIPRWRKLGLVLIAPITVNIFLYDAFLTDAHIGAGIVLVILNAIALWQYRAAYRSIFAK